MPIEHASWIIPSLEQAGKHPQEILSVWERLSELLFGKRSSIAITGMPGVGKSVLLEYLTGKAYEMGHEPPEQPTGTAEYAKLTRHRKRINLVAIPGQEIGAKEKACIKAFEGKPPLTGVLHVVADGFATIRSKPLLKDWVKKGTVSIADYQHAMRKLEVEDLRKTCSWVNRRLSKHKEPIWMLIVVSKCDLFTASFSDVETYYSPYAENDFASELNALSSVRGSVNFSWDSLPVCASLDDFHFNGETAFSSLKEQQRDFLVASLLRRIESNCA